MPRTSATGARTGRDRKVDEARREALERLDARIAKLEEKGGDPGKIRRLKARRRAHVKNARRDRREDVRDRKEDVRDRREDVRDRREDVRDRREDRRDARDGHAHEHPKATRHRAANRVRRAARRHH